MQTTTLILSGLLTVALAIMIAPSIIAMNRGRVLRNIAGWLAIMVVLALVYQNFHPDKGMAMPPIMKTDNTTPVPGTIKPQASPDAPSPASTEPSVPKITSGPDAAPDDGYTPPREE